VIRRGVTQKSRMEHPRAFQRLTRSRQVCSSVGRDCGPRDAGIESLLGIGKAPQYTSTQDGVHRSLTTYPRGRSR
jgi:hypothetical protein